MISNHATKLLFASIETPHWHYCYMLNTKAKKASLQSKLRQLICLRRWQWLREYNVYTCTLENSLKLMNTIHCGKSTDERTDQVALTTAIFSVLQRNSEQFTCTYIHVLSQNMAITVFLCATVCRFLDMHVTRWTCETNFYFHTMFTLYQPVGHHFPNINNFC